jgi:Putative methyltransferase
VPPGYDHDWRAWHAGYDDPRSSLAQRLAVVQARIVDALAAAPAGPLRVIGMCAGQGRDLIPVLARHPRGPDVSARLVELDPALAAAARLAAADHGLAGVEVVTGDAALTDAYAGLVPADLVLVCGVFGNVPDADIKRTVGCCGQLCGEGGTVVWTRGRTEPDKVPLICDWFGEQGFELCWLSDPGVIYGVGMHRHTRQPAPLAAGVRMFRFTGPD